MSGDPQIALELLARQMWITAEMACGRRDGAEAAQAWDEDWLLAATYEAWEGQARAAIASAQQAPGRA